MTASSHWIRAAQAGTTAGTGTRLTAGDWSRPALPILVVSVLLCLGAANIMARGLLQNLQVCSNGEAYEVVAGGRKRANLGVPRSH